MKRDHLIAGEQEGIPSKCCGYWYEESRIHLGLALRITGASALIALASNMTPWSVPSQALPSAR